MIHDMLTSKMQGDDDLKDDDIAANAGCSTRAVRYCRSNMLLYGSTKAPSNGAGRPKHLTPPMLTALFSQLHINPGMHQREMVAFLRKEFDVTVSRYSISRALRSAK
jgi:transposase